MNLKGQGALEYLLLIGGAVLVAAIVIALVTGIPGGTANPQDQIVCGQNVTGAACIAETEATNGCVIRGLDGLDYVSVAAMEAIPTTFAACVAAPAP